MKMGSPPIGFLDQTVELLRIETSGFTVYIQGKPFHPTVEMMRLHRAEEQQLIQAQLQIVSLSANLPLEKVMVYNPEHDEMEDWQECGVVYPVFFETQEYILVVEGTGQIHLSELSFHHDNAKLRRAIKRLGSSLLTGSLKFQNEVGLTQFEILWNGQAVLQVQLEVFPSKMDYKRDYQMILSDVNRQIYNLSFDFMRKTYHLTGLRYTSSQSLTEYFSIIQYIFKRLVQAVERIQHAPHVAFGLEHQMVDAARARRTAKHTISYLSRNPRYLQADTQGGLISIHGQKYSPTHVREAKRRIHYDTNENRFVRWVLIEVKKKLQLLIRLLSEKERYHDPVVIRHITNIQAHLNRLLRLDFLDVGEMRQFSVSLVLQMAPGYREVYRYYLMLIKGLAIQSDLFRVSMKDLAQLYEYWCFLKIHELLSIKYELVQQDLIKVNRHGIFVTLDKTQKAKIVYRYPSNGEVFTLYYNSLPRGDQTPTVGQRPDTILTLRKNESAIEYKYIFDAKYRLNPAYEGTPYHRNYKYPGPEEADINSMHRYRDAIVCADRDEGRELERSMFGAYVLFPYHDEERFVDHPFYRSIELVNVGALPFLPDATKLVESFLDEIILDSPEKAYERSTRPGGTTEYYQNKLTGKNVLVGSLRGPSQLEDARKYGFYHIPLKNITEHRILTQLEYIALYQSKRKFESQGDGAGIKWYGRIANWQIIRRKEIRERPARKGTEEELYVKFTVEKWQQRSTPILPGGRGIYTLLYTTKYMFDRASEIAELKLESKEHLELWREQRRRGAVHVELDHEQVDLARKIHGITGME